MNKLNIFSGCTQYGSEVQAFKDRGHNVTLLGLDGNIDIQMDIREFNTTEQYDFMTFHPPCTEFSKANWGLGRCKDRRPDMSIVDTCFKIVEQAKPIYWMIENPRGCLRHFIGRPQYEIRYGDYGHYCHKPTDLWGVLPWFQSYRPNTVQKKNAYSNGPRCSNIRAKLPYEFSLVLCKAIEEALK